MNSFKASIPTPIGAVEFSFSPIVTLNEVKYHISVTNKDGKSYSFTMVAKYWKWRIVNAPKVPDWILDTESSLSETIQDRLNS